MPTKTLLQRFLPEPKITSASIRPQLDKAREVARKAQSRYEAEAFDALNEGEDGSLAEAKAAEALATAQQTVARLEAALRTAETREAEANRASAEAAKAAEDAAAIVLMDALAKAAQSVADTMPAYVKAYAALVKAGDALRAVATVNPRVRHDLLHQDAQHLVALELARVSFGYPLPPG